MGVRLSLNQAIKRFPRRHQTNNLNRVSGLGFKIQWNQEQRMKLKQNPSLLTSRKGGGNDSGKPKKKRTTYPNRNWEALSTLAPKREKLLEGFISSRFFFRVPEQTDSGVVGWALYPFIAYQLHRSCEASVVRNSRTEEMLFRLSDRAEKL